jgi:phenylpropionate dioxygenase-like ring-hydroxylating dioxygenase large terminal subunit
MLTNQWYGIYDAARIKSRPVKVKRLGIEMVLWRNNEGIVICQQAACPHRGADLSMGKVQIDCIACPYHGFRFDKSGSCTLVPCDGEPNESRHGHLKLKTYHVQEAHGLVWFWFGPEREIYPPLPWFDELPKTEKFSWSMTKEVPVHFTRMIENFIDLHHVPFLHRRAVDPGIGEHLLNYQVATEGDIIRSSGYFSKSPLVCKTVTSDMSMKSFMQMDIHCPNVMMGRFGALPKFFLLGVITPIDDDHSWVFARYYQEMVQVPVLGAVLAGLMMNYEKFFIVPDDIKVLSAIRPKDATHGGNRYVEADGAITHWHKWYEDHLRATCETTLSKQPHV